MNPDLPRCQCPFASGAPMLPSLYEDEEQSSWGHAKGECPNQYKMEFVDRKGEKLWLCSSCTLSGDVEIDPYASTVALTVQGQEEDSGSV